MISIFNEIVHIMHNDYAGCFDKKGLDNPEGTLEKLRIAEKQNKLTYETFADIVKDYLLDFKDHHIHFHYVKANKKAVKTCGFSVRRYKEKLYITEVHRDLPLKPGMAFVSIGGYSLGELRVRHNRLFGEKHPERENWEPIFSLYKTAMVEDELGNITEVPISFEKEPSYTPTYSIEKISNNTLLLTMTDFMNPDAIVELITKNQLLLEVTENWIIDVRVNKGGNDSSYYPLLPYILPVEGIELSDKEDKMLFHCTHANAERQRKSMERELNKTEDEQARLFINVFKSEWEKNKGKGFVEFDFSDIIPDTFIKGKHIPKSVVVLSDNKCGSSGDSFVELCKKSNKVTVVGRATMGLNDYANLATQQWEEGFHLMYPTSRLSRIDKGLGMTGVGIEPNVYVEWTPEHIETDVDLSVAFELLSQKSMSPT